jgi:hypothetical protein
VSERIVRMLAQDFNVTTDRLRIIPYAKRVISADVTDLLLGSACGSDARNPG